MPTGSSARSGFPARRATFRTSPAAFDGPLQRSALAAGRTLSRGARSRRQRRSRQRDDVLFRRRRRRRVEDDRCGHGVAADLRSGTGGLHRRAGRRSFRSQRDLRGHGRVRHSLRPRLRRRHLSQRRRRRDMEADRPRRFEADQPHPRRSQQPANRLRRRARPRLRTQRRARHLQIHRRRRALDACPRQRTGYRHRRHRDGDRPAADSLRHDMERASPAVEHLRAA